MKTNKIYSKLYPFDVCALLFLLWLVILIEKLCLVFGFHVFPDQLFIKGYNKYFIRFHVLIYNILSKQFFMEF